MARHAGSSSMPTQAALHTMLQANVVRWRLFREACCPYEGSYVKVRRAGACGLQRISVLSLRRPVPLLINCSERLQWSTAVSSPSRRATAVRIGVAGPSVPGARPGADHHCGQLAALVHLPAGERAAHRNLH